MTAQAHQRGSVVVVVLWAIAVAAIITSSVQLFAYRQATIGREALERTQARWAARAGLEYTIEIMTDHNRRPRSDDGLALTRDMWNVSGGQLLNASYSILHHIDGRDFGGPRDEHAKLNINRMEDRGLLMVLDGMTLDVLEAVGDWLDEDSEVSMLGVERDYYRNLETPYEPRNGPIQSLAEIELIAGIWPKHFRGEDWNLNGRLDPNENDGNITFPPDNRDDVLDAGWSERLTVYSVAGGATQSGLPRIHLKYATVDELTERLGVNDAQAQALIDFGQSSTNSLIDLMFNPLSGTDPNAGTPQNQGRQSGGRQQPQPQQPQQPRANTTTELTEVQLQAVLAETCIEDPLDRVPGKININTVSAKFLREIIVLLGHDEALADEILFLRDSRPQGILSLLEFRQIPNIEPEQLRELLQRFDIVSNVFTVSSRGRSVGSGLEVEMIVVVDRSTIPVRIIEYREQ